jgi:hypothetical protein
MAPLSPPRLWEILDAMARQQPVAVCTVCDHFSSNMNLINEQCGERPGGKRCKGVNGSALNVTDWKLCGECAGEGCEACRDSGWKFVRR